MRAATRTMVDRGLRSGRTAVRWSHLVELVNLPIRQADRWLALDAKDLRCTPHLPHDPRDARAGADRGQEDFCDRAFVEWAEGWVHQQP